jgi:hypothetical protein
MFGIELIESTFRAEVVTFCFVQQARSAVPTSISTCGVSYVAEATDGNRSISPMPLVERCEQEN